MEIAGSLIIKDCAFMMDGGTKLLVCFDSNGNRHDIQLIQHIDFSGRNPKRIPGRLYHNQNLIALRSEEEVEVILKLKAAGIDMPMSKEQKAFEPRPNRTIIGNDIKNFFESAAKGPGVAATKMKEEIIEFVESEKYLMTANRVKELGWMNEEK